MKEVEFKNLPRPVQDRLLESLSGGYDPKPILHRPGSHPTAWLWLALSVASAVALGILFRLGLGDTSSALSLHPTPVVVVYGLLGALVTIGLLNALVARIRVTSMPFSPGVYLFTGTLIDARNRRLKAYPIEELTQVAPSGRGVAVTFGSARFTLPLSDPKRAQEAVQLISSAGERVAQAASRFDYDPLEPPPVTSPLAPTIPIARRPPLWERQRWLLGALVGGSLGVLLFPSRNNISDRRMLRAAQQENTVNGYQRYLKRGEKHQELVAKTLLPRAALRKAIEARTVAAVDTFKKEYPDTNIETEVDAARRAAMTIEFEAARKAGKLSTLLAFAARHPKHGMGAAFTSAKQALFQRALKRFQAQLPPDSEEVGEFVGKLFDYSLKVGVTKAKDGAAGPTVEIRYQRLPSKTLKRADAAVQKNPMFNGSVSYASSYFKVDRLEPHENALTKRLSARLSQAFEKEILTFAAGEPVDGEELPKVKTPTLLVTHRVEWSGGAIASENPRGVFIEVYMFFRVTFLLPDGDTTLRKKFTAQQRIPGDLLKAAGGAREPGKVEAKVYDTMVRHAFSELSERYLAHWFQSDADK